MIKEYKLTIEFDDDADVEYLEDELLDVTNAILDIVSYSCSAEISKLDKKEEA